MGALYLDTETTGLNGGTGTLAFLVGLAFWVQDEIGSALVVEQLLLRSPGEEAPILEHVALRMRQASMVVTFNGKAFDLPLLRTRFAMARMDAPKEPPHLDLVHVARRIHRDPAGPCKLTALEDRVLGFVRVGDVPSGEVSACYLHFLRTGDTRSLVGVVEHNAWDVVAMASLVGLYGEPLETSRLSAADLVGVGRTLFRAGEKKSALEAVERAVQGGAGDPALRTRAQFYKKMGQKAQALTELEALAARRDDDPTLLLELAKLYEHFAKDPKKALATCLRGTSETLEAAAKRRARLEGKIEDIQEDEKARGL
jgi:tetratricopeptide (TPR) repeat protein